MNNPVFCAIDTQDIAHAKNLITQVTAHTGGIKLGLEFFLSHGVTGVKAVIGNAPLFLDLKFHDIPNTVAGAVRAVAPLGAQFINVHAAGGFDMMQRAKAEAEEQAAKLNIKPPAVLGVTVLTSLDDRDLESTGQQGPAQEQVLRLAALTQKSGLDGIVCSAHEIETLRQTCGPEFILMVPGIRPENAGQDDQKRTMTPRQALDAGASHLVIGRPITQDNNPAQAAENIFIGLQNAG